MAKRQVMGVDVFIDSNVESEERIRAYVIQAFKNACKNIRDGTVLVVIRDENERILGVDLSGTPTPELQDSFDDMIDKLESPPVVPRPPPHGRP